jgi:hypothetical protein
MVGNLPNCHLGVSALDCRLRPWLIGRTIDHRILGSSASHQPAEAVSNAEKFRRGPGIERRKTWPAPAGASRVKSFDIYRYEPDSGDNPRLVAKQTLLISG